MSTRSIQSLGLLCLGILWLAGLPATSQSFNLDFGQPGDGPAATYGAAGLAGTWNSFLASHGSTTSNLLGLDGLPTGVSMSQIGGLDTVSDSDPATSGGDALLMDDYLVTFSAGLESCLFFDNLEAGDYEILLYARMPEQPLVFGDTFVDQEVGVPHYSVGGVWPGAHQELITYSRHFATVGVDGNLDMHSGIVPGANPALGAALNGVQLRLLSDPFFADDFETGDTSGWTAAVP
ncbi:MAG: hypothetical protein K0U98_00280 [Deltaproteobacteria bacterium]|nr:hypothetical protein [Deltaproteobacteria bacterium]